MAPTPESRSPTIVHLLQTSGGLFSPLKFKPGPIEKYDDTTNPREWIQIYSMVIKAVYGDDYVKANHLPTVL